LTAIVKWTDASPARRSGDALDAIFFEASGTKTFTSDEGRSAFRERWLGRYLRDYPEWVYLALDDKNGLAGYLLGCLDDPARTPLFDDIGYFQEFRALTARFPAQLHVNLAPSARGAAIGVQLVEAFARDACTAGSPGMHAVTERGMRNVSFYERNRFHERGHVTWNGRDLVFLGRDLVPVS
jgi:GNAT superfamily N-acetyltransferase